MPKQFDESLCLVTGSCSCGIGLYSDQKVLTLSLLEASDMARVPKLQAVCNLTLNESSVEGVIFKCVPDPLCRFYSTVWEYLLHCILFYKPKKI